MKKWIKNGLVPRQGASMDPGEIVFRGKLRSIWLGGLYNPAALLTALKHEKAILSDTTYDQVRTNVWHLQRLQRARVIYYI